MLIRFESDTPTLKNFNNYKDNKFETSIKNDSSKSQNNKISSSDTSCPPRKVYSVGENIEHLSSEEKVSTLPQLDALRFSSGITGESLRYTTSKGSLFKNFKLQLNSKDINDNTHLPTAQNLPSIKEPIKLVDTNPTKHRLYSQIYSETNQLVQPLDISRCSMKPSNILQVCLQIYTYFVRVINVTRYRLSILI